MIAYVDFVCGLAPLGAFCSGRKDAFRVAHSIKPTAHLHPETLVRGVPPPGP
jgi:hypothetical protein